MELEAWHQMLLRAAAMDRHELLDRSRQEICKRSDALLSLLGFNFSRNLIPRADIRPGRFFFTPASLPSVLNLLGQRLPQQANRIIQVADKICLHRFNLLGYEDLDYGDPIDWHLDAVHGKRAPKKVFYKIRYLDFDEVGDSKITWELNRHQHLVILAKAYRLTDDHRYADEIFRQWEQWHRENPYAVGINWASSLEVAFRSISWNWVYALLEATPAMPLSFRKEWLRAQALNGRHIERYLSTYFSPNTHLLGEAVALLFLGILCPELPAAEQWRSLGWQLVLQQANRQVLDDGFHFERSTYYHVYALDFFLHAVVLASLNDLPIPTEFETTLKRMLEALFVLGVQGAPPQLGDDDGGRVFDPNRNRSEHLLDSLAAGAILFHRQDFKAAASGLREETLWLLGEQGVAEWDSLESQPRGLASVALPSAGLYSLATAATPAQLVIDAGPKSPRGAGHSHAGALSISLRSQGHALLVDPGTFEYVGPGSERELFRSTAMHNTLRVDSASQSEPDGPFAWKQIAQAKTEQWINGETFDFFVGSHDGYKPLASSVVHRRSIFALKAGFFLVRDVASGVGKHRLDIAWHLAPEMRLRAEHLYQVKGFSNGLALIFSQKHGWSEEVRKDVCSPVYGKKQAITVLNFGAVADLPAEFVTLLVLLEEVGQIPGQLAQFKTGAASGVKSYLYNTPSHDYSFFFAEPTPWNQGRVSSDAEFVCWQRKHDSEDQLLLFCNGSYVEIDGQRIVSYERRVIRYELLVQGGQKYVYASEPEQLGCVSN
jgi:hypothetical protein